MPGQDDPRPSTSVHTSKQSRIDVSPHIEFCKWSREHDDVTPIEPKESEFRHSGWAVRRSQIWCALQRINADENRLSRFANCGSAMYLAVSASKDDIRICSNKCHDRFCVACASEKAGIIAANIAELIKDASRSRFYTFTMRHNRTSLADQIDRLYDCFAKLRRRDSFKNHCSGGAAFLETKIGDDGLWHVHLHCIIEGNFWDQRHLSTEWLAVTGDSSIVDVRKINDAEGRARYVTKYVTKPADTSVYRHDDKLDEFITSYRGRRLCLTFGTWRGKKLAEVKADDVEWQRIGSVENLRNNAADGDPEAARYLQAAARKYPLFASMFSFTARPPPDFEE